MADLKTVSGLLISLAAAVHPSPQQTAFARQMLAAHNAVRSRVGVPPLAWSEGLAGRAGSWANHLLSRRQFSHPSQSPYGENLFEIRGSRESPDGVVGQWAAESAKYDYRGNRCRGVCGHYTQLVWRSTSRVGCAVARGRDVEIWVCEYDPPGNVVGERPY